MNHTVRRYGGLLTPSSSALAALLMLLQDRIFTEMLSSGCTCMLNNAAYHVSLYTDHFTKSVCVTFLLKSSAVCDAHSKTDSDDSVGTMLQSW